MKLVKCLKGHMYNAEKFSKCPYCATIEVKGDMESVEENQDEVDTEEPDQVVRQKYEIVGRRKVVGCLVCVRGVMTGEAFLLVEGHNDIGRGANLEVALSKDVTVSRKAHACITYEREQNRYYLAAAENKRDVLYNGEMVENAVLIENRGVIQIGQCSLRFMAFCDEGFVWGD